MENIAPDPTAISDYIHATKYAKYLPEKQRRETFPETVSRVKQMHLDTYPELSLSIEAAFNLVYSKKVLPSMRSLQFAGDPILKHNARMYNCSFTLIDRPRVFAEIMYLLLCGCGVGYSVQKQHVAQLPKFKKVDTTLVCHHTIEDSIQGWAQAVNSLIQGHIHGYCVEFNYSNIRPAGSDLSSQCKAPGHWSLKVSLENVREILSKVNNRKLKPIECHDIICHMSTSVLAGGIRRSSLMAIFSFDDEEMQTAKENENFEFGGKNSQRALANNSAVLTNENTQEDFAKIIDINRKNFGDPGFVFLQDLDYGTNPCGEIVLYPKDKDGNTGFAFCNLVEINAAACTDPDEFLLACKEAAVIATLQAGYKSFPYLGEVSERIATENPLIGVSISGMMDSPWIFDANLLKKGAHQVMWANEIMAKAIGINPSSRCTCIKPSGTSSLELGCIGSGIHPHHAKKYFRRITTNLLEEAASYFEEINPHMLEHKSNFEACIVFPVQTDGLTKDDLTLKDFLDKIFLVYKNWVQEGSNKKVSHNISCTVTVKPEEWDWVKEYVWSNRNLIGGMSFFPDQADDHIPFCPRQAVKTEEDLAKFNELIVKYKPVNYANMVEKEGTNIYDIACDNEACSLSMDSLTVEIAGKGCRVFEGSYTNKDKYFEIDGLAFTLLRRHQGFYIAKRVELREREEHNET